MKLLIFTQKVNKEDPVLGFFHRWLVEFSKKFEKITVICLEEGRHNLPLNVRVLSLGKEKGYSRIHYILHFYTYIWRERKNYDAVFVHMNQEYVLLGWKIWKLLGKPIYMWRNHHAGTFFTDIAAFFCTKVFCTSKFSYTAKYKKTVIMPVGIDTELFKPTGAQRATNSVLFLSRMAPSKRPELLINALKILKGNSVNVNATFIGNPLPKDQTYLNVLKRESNEGIQFKAGIPNEETVAVYNSNLISVNTSSSGMYDKTIFEAAACETLPLSSNENVRGQIDERLLFKENDADDLARKLAILLALPTDESAKIGRQVREYVQGNHSLVILAEKLKTELHG